jgi:pimeloyl-ACP methyl ester carboxylesterase
MTAFVLVHGGWHGGFCWRFVAPALRRAGHDVYTPSLTGLGDRAHLARPGIDLELHIQDVVAVLEMEDLREVVLLGHSYGGMVVTGAADRCTARIRNLVYLDAFVPENGKCALDVSEDRS